MIKVSKTKLEGVLTIEPEIFEDHRGDYIELYNEKLYKESGITVSFVTDSDIVSSKHVLRGIHGDSRTWKLISCARGKLYLAVVNCEEGSKDFGAWESFAISEKNRKQVLVPAKYGVAHLVMSDWGVYHYKQSEYYEGMENQFTYRWDDPKFGIWWPIKNPILSRRDESGTSVH